MTDHPDYTVIGTLRTRTLRVIWLLEELGLPYTHLPAPPHAAEVKAQNPTGKVPVLLADGAVLTDSVAILTFLADRHAAFTLPAGSLGRGRQDGLTQRILDDLEAPIWAAARHKFVLPEAMRQPLVIPAMQAEFARNQAAFAEQMGKGPFLMGAEMTIADIVLTHSLLWAQLSRFPEPDPALAAYLDRMRTRPALLRAQQA